MGLRDDTSGLIGDLCRLGTIETVDLASARATVKLGDVLSPPCPWLEMAGAYRSWCPPGVGEQVLVLCPEGDIAHAVILRGLFSTNFPAPANDGKAVIQMPDGTTIVYDPQSHDLAITLAGGSCTISAPQGLSITGPVNITGTLNASEDVLAGGISLKSHKHSGVQAGAAQTGGPV